MAHNNRPKNAPNKPTEYSRPSGTPGQKGPGGAAAAFKPSQGAGSKKPEYSRKQDEVDRRASPNRNTVPQSTGTGAGSLNSIPRAGEPKEYSEKQDEFDTTALPSENTAPQFSSPSAVDPAQAKGPSQPLPDLTRGIPSTLEYEATGNTSTSPLKLNLTETEESEQSSGGGGSGRGRGELPASAYVTSSEKKRLRLANYLYGMFAVASVTGTIYLGRNWEDEEEEKAHLDAPSGWALRLMWNRAKARMGDQLNYYNEPAFRKLLPDPDPIFERPYTLVLSMEDLLIHSEWTREHGWRMAKRPGVDYFLRYLSQYYELVIFTSQPWAVAEPIIRKLDPFHIVTWPLFREATMYENGEYVKVRHDKNDDVTS